MPVVIGYEIVWSISFGKGLVKKPDYLAWNDGQREVDAAEIVLGKKARSPREIAEIHAEMCCKDTGYSPHRILVHVKEERTGEITSWDVERKLTYTASEAKK